MRKSIPLILATLVLAAPVAPAAARDKLTGEQQLAKRLEGRVAGKPTSCLRLYDTQTMEVIDKTAIVFGWGDTLWVNRPRDPGALDSDDVLVHKTSGGEWCSIDIVTQHDRPGLWFKGSLSLGDFVPYTRVKPAPARVGG